MRLQRLPEESWWRPTGGLSGRTARLRRNCGRVTSGSASPRGAFRLAYPWLSGSRIWRQASSHSPLDRSQEVNRPHGAARGRDSLCCPAAPARITGIHGPSTDSMSRQNDLRSVIRESQPGTGVPSSLLGARFGWHLFREPGTRYHHPISALIASSVPSNVQLQLRAPAGAAGAPQPP